jgi:flagellar motor switch protein FliM
MSQLHADIPVTRQLLLDAMRKMRSLVEPESPAPEAALVDWRIPRRLHAGSVEQLKLLAAKLAASLEKSLNNVSGQAFEVTAEDVKERYANHLFEHVMQDKPKVYYLPLIQAAKSHAGFISLPFETAAVLVGCMLRDPEAQIGKEGQMSSLAESILTDAAIALAEALTAGFKEYGLAALDKTDQLVYIDWPVRFHDLEDMCEFHFKAVCGKTTLTLTLSVLDEIIADIAQIKGPFGKPEEKKGNSDRIAKQMHNASMGVTALLSTSLMTLNDILTLEEGDVVILDRKTGDPVDVLINGQPCFCAWPVACTGRRALLVADEKNRLV